MKVKTLIKVLDIENTSNSLIKVRTYDKLNGFQTFDIDDKSIQKADVINVVIRHDKNLTGNQIDIEIQAKRNDVDLFKEYVNIAHKGGIK